MSQIYLLLCLFRDMGKPLAQTLETLRQRRCLGLSKAVTPLWHLPKSDNDYAVQLPYQLSNRMAVVMQVVNFNHRNIFGLQAMARFFGRLVAQRQRLCYRHVHQRQEQPLFRFAFQSQPFHRSHGWQPLGFVE